MLVANSQADPLTHAGRLTLTSGVPVTTSDVTAATTVYLTPYRGEDTCLFANGVWTRYLLNECSIAVPSNTNTPFDIFEFWNDTGVAIAAVPWTNATTRATGLTLQNNVLVKSGDATQKYRGTGCTTGTSGKCEDSRVNRLLYNWYNQVPRDVGCAASASHTYNSATVRPFNNSSANKFTLVVGGTVSIAMLVETVAQCWNYGAMGSGLNTTSAFTDSTYGVCYSGTTADLQIGNGFAMVVPIGLNVVQLNEAGSASPVANFGRGALFATPLM